MDIRDADYSVGRKRESHFTSSFCGNNCNFSDNPIYFVTNNNRNYSRKRSEIVLKNGKAKLKLL